MARGLARMLGFDIMVNFNLPYAASSLRDFWRRWHISLSTWLRDYLYISLGGNRCSSARLSWNIVLTFFLGGLWHGAAWHFVLWGAYHGLGLATSRGLSASPTSGQTPRPGRVAVLVGWLGTMFFVFYGWLLFRAESVAQIVHMTRALGDWTTPFWMQSFLINLGVFTCPLILMETWQFKSGNLVAPLALPYWAKAGLQGVLLAAIVLYWERTNTQFIYFQF
jgi:alginate O-acetyltransferase complex protein AlgI